MNSQNIFKIINKLFEKKTIALGLILAPALILLIYITTFYNPIGNLKNVPIGIIDLSHSKESADLIINLLTDPKYKFEIMNINDFKNSQKYINHLKHLYGYLIIPKDYSEKLRNGIATNLTFISNVEKNYLIYRTLNSYNKILEEKLKATILKKALNKTLINVRKNILVDYKLNQNIRQINHYENKIIAAQKKSVLISKVLHLPALIPTISSKTIKTQLKLNNYNKQIANILSLKQTNYKYYTSLLSKTSEINQTKSNLKYGDFFISIFIVMTSFIGCASASLFIFNIKEDDEKKKNSKNIFERTAAIFIISLLQGIVLFITALILMKINRIFDFFFMIIILSITNTAIISGTISLILYLFKKEVKLDDKDIKLAYPVISILTILFLVSSGGIWPVETLPKFYQIIALINPFYYLSKLFRTILYSYSIPSIFPEFLIIIIFAAIIFILEWFELNNSKTEVE